MIEYIINNMWQLWAVIAVLCLIIELSSGDFFIICFSIGGLMAAFGAALGLSLYVQILLFALVTLLSIFFVRPVALRWFHRGEDNRVSNADALLGREGRVVEAVEAGGFGRVQIDGDVWKARSADGSPIAVGTVVYVSDRQSTIITVDVK